MESQYRQEMSQLVRHLNTKWMLPLLSTSLFPKVTQVFVVLK